MCRQSREVTYLYTSDAAATTTASEWTLAQHLPSLTSPKLINGEYAIMQIKCDP